MNTILKCLAEKDVKGKGEWMLNFNYNQAQTDAAFPVHVGEMR